MSTIFSPGPLSKVIRKAVALIGILVCCIGVRPSEAFSLQQTRFVTVRSSRPLLPYRNSEWKNTSVSRYQSLVVKKNQPLNSRYWEGDDIRWVRKFRRRFRRLFGKSPSPARTSLVLLNVAFFLYQVANAVGNIRQRYPAYWPTDAVSIVTDVLVGRSITGPFTMDFIHSRSLSRYQPHRYLTAAFLHGNLFHLAVNLNALLSLPQWLESGLGWPLYVTTYLVSIVSGNLAHRDPSSLCVGASGGICGLYGLMFTALQRMGNSTASSSILRGMAFMVFIGLIVENISNAAHIGGFFAGLAVGYLCGPGYRKSYSMRRKWSLDVDSAPSDYRGAMGFGNTPTRNLVPVQLIWVATLVAFLTQPKFKSIPRLVLSGLLHPGSLTGPRYL